MEVTDLVIVGAGPCGLAAAIAAQRAGLRAVVFDRGCLVHGLTHYPAEMTFFSTAERLAIGGVPFIVATDKPTRRDALTYYREVASHCALDVRQYRTVDAVVPVHEVPETVTPSGRPVQWRVMTRPLVGAPSEVGAHALVIATGYFGNPRRLGVPGEGLPHVRHGYTEGHTAWGQQVVIVGGANSAVDAALTMLRAGARVTLVHTGEGISDRVKPWVRPEIEARIREGRIAVRFGSRVTAIEPEAVCVAGPAGEEWLSATQVYTMIGYHPETGLLAQAGVPIDHESGIPAHDPATMATPVRGVYLAGVIASGNQANRIFIENGRDHGDAIIAHLTGAGSTVSP